MSLLQVKWHLLIPQIRQVGLLDALAFPQIIALFLKIEDSRSFVMYTVTLNYAMKFLLAHFTLIVYSVFIKEVHCA